MKKLNYMSDQAFNETADFAYYTMTSELDVFFQR